MADWLMIRPVIDDVTVITYDEAQDVLNYFDEKGVEYIDLAKEDATREKVEKILKENPDISVLHYDHGSKTSWIGRNGAVVDLDNVGLLKQRQCYCNNCSSAAELGVQAWELGCTAYWGYDDIFYFTTDALEEFSQFVNNGIKRRCDGYSWKECLQMTKELANKLIDSLVKAGKALAASCLRHDRDCLVCYTEGMPPSPPTCPFSRLIVAIFGRSALYRVRRFRGILKRSGNN